MSKRKITLADPMDEATFDRLVTGMARDMFLSGLCFGAALTGFYAMGAYTLLGIALGCGALSVLWRGWPWEYRV